MRFRSLRVCWRLLRYGATQLLRGRLLSDPSGPARLVRLFEDLGGIYLKLGQLLSLQADVLPRDYCNALFDLLDRVPPMPWKSVAAVIAEELGRPAEECFDTIERTPLASASIAQVHLATVGGRRVAVKVRRPDAARRFYADLAALQLVPRLVRSLRLHSLEWLGHAIEELSRWTREELDFRQEARYQRALRYLARNNPREVIPLVIDALSSEAVLTSALLEGPTLLQVVRHLEADRGAGSHTCDQEPEAALQRELDRLGFDAPIFAETLIENFISAAAERGVFHADLHPANLIVLDDNRIGYVDFGITSALSRYSRRHILALILALVEADSGRLGLHLEALADPQPTAQRERFRRELEAGTSRWYRDAEAQEPRMASRFTVVMLDILRICRRNGMMATPDTARYLRSVIAAEGLIARFAPGFDAEACLRQIAKEQVASEAVRQWLDGDRLADWIHQAAENAAELPDLLVEWIETAAPDAGGDSRTGSADWRPGRRPPPIRSGSALALGLSSLALGLYLASLEAPDWSAWTTVLPSLAMVLVTLTFLRAATR